MQASTQSTESHQPGQYFILILNNVPVYAYKIIIHSSVDGHLGHLGQLTGLLFAYHDNAAINTHIQVLYRHYLNSLGRIIFE